MVLVLEDTYVWVSRGVLDACTRQSSARAALTDVVDVDVDVR